MQMTATSELDPHPAGVYPAVCVDVIDMGPQPRSLPEGTTRVAPLLRLVLETVLTRTQPVRLPGAFRDQKLQHLIWFRK